jgi:hypothetical protein
MRARWAPNSSISASSGTGLPGDAGRAARVLEIGNLPVEVSGIHAPRAGIALIAGDSYHIPL